jgi:hypothetical protein
VSAAERVNSAAMLLLLGLFFAGVFLCNALPHLVSGLRGERFHTPWARPRGVGMSSALENVLWGSANLMVAVFLIDRIYPRNVPHGMSAIALGFVLAGCAMSVAFSRRRSD